MTELNKTKARLPKKTERSNDVDELMEWRYLAAGKRGAERWDLSLMQASTMNLLYPTYADAKGVSECGGTCSRSYLSFRH